MRYLLNREKRQEIAESVRTLLFKWTISRGRDTYGYNICTLWIGNARVAACNGGGYDMSGTCLGAWIEKRFHEQLKQLRPSDFCGLSFWDPKARKYRKAYRPGCIVSLDGGCGFSCMENILGKLGFRLQYVGERGRCHSDTEYILRAL